MADILKQVTRAAQKKGSNEDALNGNPVPRAQVHQALNTVVRDLAKHGYLHPSRTHMLETPDTKRQISRLIERITTGKINLENYNLNKVKSRGTSVPAPRVVKTSGETRPSSVSPANIRTVQEIGTETAEFLFKPRKASESASKSKGNKLTKGKRSRTKTTGSIEEARHRFAEDLEAGKAKVAAEIGTGRDSTVVVKPKQLQFQLDEDQVKDSNNNPGTGTSDPASGSGSPNAATVPKKKKSKAKGKRLRENQLDGASLAIGVHDLIETGPSRGAGRKRSKPSRKKKSIQIPKSKLLKDVSAALARGEKIAEDSMEAPVTLKLKPKRKKTVPNSSASLPEESGSGSVLVETKDIKKNIVSNDSLRKATTNSGQRSKKILDEAETKVTVGNLDQLKDFNVLQFSNPARQVTLRKLGTDEQTDGLLGAISVGNADPSAKSSDSARKKVFQLPNIQQCFHTEVNLPGFDNENISFQMDGRSLIIIAYRPKDRYHHARKVTEIVEIPESVNVENLKLGRKSNGAVWIEEWTLNEHDESVQADLNLLSPGYSSNRKSIAIPTLQGSSPTSTLASAPGDTPISNRFRY